MVCEQCGRTGVPTRAVCMYCGGRLIEQEKREITIRCPVCNINMDKGDQAGITLDNCSSCGGTWYDRSELEQLLRKSKDDLEKVEEQPASKDPEEPSPSLGFSRQERDAFFRSGRTGNVSRRAVRQSKSVYRKCPHCQSMMNRVNYLQKTGVVVDVCRQHGIFLDEGEFDALYAFIQTRPWT